jgi:outer membrane protein assembly factor BamB
LGTIKGDLYLFNPLTFNKKWITKINNSVNTLYEDSYGLVWFGGVGTGLFCYDPNKDTINQYYS